MDYKLENINLSLNEKNKKNFNEFISGNNKLLVEDSENIPDSLQMYNNFVSEKSSLLEVINEIRSFVYLESLQFYKQQEYNEDFTSFVNIQSQTHKIDESSVKNLIKNKSDLEDYKNRIIMILEEYQEQPGLLDTILEEMLRPLIEAFYIIVKLIYQVYIFGNRIKEINDVYLIFYLRCISQIIYVICKVRGYETVSKYFYSEVKVFEPVILLMINISKRQEDNWQLLYVLSLWTSILGLIPFDIETIDTSKTLISNLVSYYKESLSLSTSLREIIAYSLSKFYTRKDCIKNGLLNEFIEWSINQIKSQSIESFDLFLCVGIFSSLSKIFRNGNRDDLEQYVEKTTNILIEGKILKELNDSNLIRKYRTRLAEKLGITTLKPRSQSWRYKMSFKELISNKNKKLESVEHEQNDDSNNDLDIDYNIIESILDYLLNSLVDKDYVVRWTAAKGIGRISERLTQDMVNDIIHSILDNLNSYEETDLQGSCLAIAEMCKRGLILPNHLNRITDLLNKVLLFEVNRGGFCTGSIVRDSACYVVWALARAYTPDVMKPLVEKMSTCLILSMLFDKEVIIRRAASAAFQEHVGRQGYFPHGIEIITESDYFTLGNRTNSYLNISLFVAQYEEYQESIITYVSTDRLYHADIQIRENSAELLGLLVSFNKDIFLNKVISLIQNKLFDSNIFTRHGAILGISYILVGLKGKWDFEYKSRIIRLRVLESMSQSEKKVLEDSDYRKEFENKYSQIKFTDYFNDISSDLMNQLLSIPREYSKQGLLTSKGAEIMRIGVNKFIKLISICDAPLDENMFFNYIDILLDNLKHYSLEIQELASETFEFLISTYYNRLKDNNSSTKDKLSKIFKEVLHLSVNDDTIFVTRGYSMIVSHFPIDIIIENLNEVSVNLMKNCIIKKVDNLESSNNDAETRRISVEAIAILIIKLLNLEVKDKNEEIVEIIENFIIRLTECFNDYEIDKKLGDVGSKVRESCCKVFPSLFFCLSIKSKSLFDKYSLKFIKCILKQLCEKMNKIRLQAGNSLQLFFDLLKNKLNSEKHIEDKEYYSFINNSIKYLDTFLELFCSNNSEMSLESKKIIEYEKEKDTKYIKSNDCTQWMEPNFTFPLVMKLFKLKDFTPDILSGLIFSIGGLTEDVAKISIKCLDIEVLNDNTIVERIYSIIIEIFNSNKGNDYVICALYSLLNILLGKSYMKIDCYPKYLDQIQKKIIEENATNPNIHRMLICPDIYFNILLFPKENEYNCYNRALKSLLFLMTHKYPTVRKKAADKLYLYLLSIEDPNEIGLEQDEIDNISIILGDTDWTLPSKTVAEIRNEIAALLKITMK